jgi:hypothetical protein
VKITVWGVRRRTTQVAAATRLAAGRLRARHKRM